MAAEIVGQVTVGQCVPTLSGLVAQLTAELTGKLTGYLNISAALTLTPPAIAAQLEGTLALVAQLEAQLSAGLSVSPPGVGLSVAAVAGIMAELNASLALLLALTEAMAVAGISVISYTGTAGQYGSAMQGRVSDIAPPDNAVQAITFLATEPAAFAALGAVLLTG